MAALGARQNFFPTSTSNAVSVIIAFLLAHGWTDAGDSTGDIVYGGADSVGRVPYLKIQENGAGILQISVGTGSDGSGTLTFPAGWSSWGSTYTFDVCSRVLTDRPAVILCTDRWVLFAQPDRFVDSPEILLAGFMEDWEAAVDRPMPAIGILSRSTGDAFRQVSLKNAPSYVYAVKAGSDPTGSQFSTFLGIGVLTSSTNAERLVEQKNGALVGGNSPNGPAYPCVKAFLCTMQTANPYVWGWLKGAMLVPMLLDYDSGTGSGVGFQSAVYGPDGDGVYEVYLNAAPAGVLDFSLSSNSNWWLMLATGETVDIDDF